MKEHYDIALLGVGIGCNYGSVLTYYGLHEVLKSMRKSVLLVSKIGAKQGDIELQDTHALRFAKEHYDISEVYNTDTIHNLNDLADTFILGSDQVFNYGISKNFGKAFYLDFTNDNKRRISYASSFGHGVDFAPEDERVKISELMSRFDAISVREEDGVAILKDVYGIKGTRVCDPIMLAGKNVLLPLADKSSKKQTSPYILAYILDPTPEKREAILKLSEQMGEKYVIVLDGFPNKYEMNQMLMGLECEKNVQTEDFVYLYKNCSYVLTDSFHGTLLAALFSKPFITFTNSARGVSRMKQLYEIIGHKERLFSDHSKAVEEIGSLPPVDFTAIDNAFEKEREFSLKWLTDALFLPKEELSGVRFLQTGLNPFYGTSSYQNKVNEPYDICPKNNCTGCSACYNACSVNAINMTEDNEGFLYPIIDKEKCINCGKCSKACPVLNPTDEKILSNTPPSAVYAAYSLDEENRFMSTSGGSFTEFAKYILSLGGVCFGAAYDENLSVRHICVDDPDELYKLRQSKYYQSTVGDIFRKVKEQLDNDRYVLFCGTPCQTAGLSNFLGKGYRQKYDKLVIVDFICHSVNSPKAFKAYIRELEQKRGAKVSRVWFKNKENGWHRFSQRIDFDDSGKEYLTRWTGDPFMRGFLTYRAYFRPSCHDCNFKEFKRCSDITLADFWGLSWNNNEQKDDQEKGVSVIMTNTPLGESLFEKIKDRFYFEKHKLEEVGAKNGGLYRSQKVGLYRDFFFREVDRTPFSDIINAMAEREKYLRDNEINTSKGGIFGKVTKIGNVVINMHPTAKIIVADGAELILNANLPRGSNQECVIILHENAVLNVNGRVKLCYGAVMQLFKGAKLTLGGGFVNAYSTFAIKKSAVIGKDFLCGRHLNFLDSDHHKVMDIATGKHLNPAVSNVRIDNHVWLGEGVTITKDVTIGENSVIGTHSVVTRSIPANCLAVGSPARVIRENITWEM